MSDFISNFFSWSVSKETENIKTKTEPKVETKKIEEPKVEIKINNGRDKVSKRFRKLKPKVEEVDVEDVDA